MRVYYTDKNGLRKPVWFASYGIGPTRVMGALVEVSHDEKGIVWFPEAAPFTVHLIELPGGKGKEVYEKLSDAGVEVLWDDRDLPAGEKFADCDLIGIPVRLVVSAKTADKIEWKERVSEETKLLSFTEVIRAVKSLLP
jgi:prolyl-tRNA synthetase